MTQAFHYYHVLHVKPIIHIHSSIIATYVIHVIQLTQHLFGP